MSKTTQPDPISQEGTWWVYWADFDWVGARILYNAGNPKLWMPAGLLAHKTLEQYMKALLRSYGADHEWRGLAGHDLLRLAGDCASHDSYFSDSATERRVGVFYDLYRAWRYPQVVRGSEISAEVQVQGGNQLVLLDELVQEIRPRIKFKKLGLPASFEQLHGMLPEGGQFIQLAKHQNHKFDSMEAGIE